MNTSSREFSNVALNEILKHKDFDKLQRKHCAKDYSDMNDALPDKADYTPKEIRQWVNVWYEHLKLQEQ